MTFLQVKELHTGYGQNEIIHGIDFQVARGETVAILGPNGCGKSTFIKAVLGYLRITQGHVSFDDKEIEDHSPTQRILLGMGYIPQLLNTFTPLTVRENLEMGGYGLSKQELTPSMERVFALFPNLNERRSQRAGSLSGGERQLLAMGRAMMPSPKLLFMDEPSAGLSPKMADEVVDHIQAIARTGTSIVIVEQDVHRSLSIADRGYVFVTGKVDFEGSPDSILKDKRIREAFLGG